MKKRRLISAAAFILTAIMLVAAYAGITHPPDERVPGASGSERKLIRVWIASSVGGGESWLKACLKEWEKSHPAMMTYLRTVPPDELLRSDAVLPDLILYTPGDIMNPDRFFSPLKGGEGVREALLRSGRWQNQLYGLPLCYGAYVLAIDSAYEPHHASTPAPTTLLGKPAATALPNATDEPGYPLEAVSKADVPLIAPRGAGLFTLACLLPQGQRPPLTEGFASTEAADVYQRFQARQAASAVLTTGQLTALTGIVSAGKGFPFRAMAPSEVITDQVWMGSIATGGAEEAAELLAYLISDASQRRLSQQGLYTVLENLRLYASGTEARVEQAAGRSLTAVSAYIPAADVAQSAWQAFQGTVGWSEALMPLL